MSTLKRCQLTICALLFTTAWIFSVARADTFAKSVVSTEQVRAELMAHAPQGVSAGQKIWVGLQLAHQPDWHTYWKNPGDSGLPTSLEWNMPPGVNAGEIEWPKPHKITIGNLVNYGYDGKILLPVPLEISPNFKPGVLSSDLEIKLKAFWLVCRKECIPQEGEFLLKIPLKSSTALNAEDFSRAIAAQPKEITDQTAKSEVQGQNLLLSLSNLPVSEQGKKLEIFPEEPEIIAPAAAWTQAWKGNVWTTSVPLSPQRSQSPQAISWVIVGANGSYRTQVNVNGAWPAALDSQELASLQPSASLPTPPADIGFAVALLGALLGGLILNLMPCVFPVLAIKVMGFARHANDKHAHRVSGIAYTVGIVLSFLALGSLMLVLRAAGEQLGWGFQLQSPAVVAALALLFTAMGLNLAGLFEFGQILPHRLRTLESRNPAINAFLSGVLAVAVASPCTAPFMGASLGFAAAMPAAQAISVFAALGLGMAFPYLLASLVPSVVHLLPSPGAWMETFRRFMAFPLFTTVIWLVWVLGQQTGIDGASALLATLLATTFALWSISLVGKTRQIVGGLSLFLLALTIGVMGPVAVKASDPSNTPTSQGIWQAWEPGKVEQLTSANQLVFVDFTAAWCVTCQYNKKTTLANETVLADLKAKNVALLRADWTRRDPAISATLSGLGRSGVPVYVFYKKGAAPQILSEVLGVDEIRAVIDSL